MSQFRRMTPRSNAHPFVHFITRKMNERQITPGEIERAVGMGMNVTRDWRGGTRPRIDILEAALDYLGYRLEIVPKGEQEMKRKLKRPMIDKADELIAGGLPIRAAAREVGCKESTLRRHYSYAPVIETGPRLKVPDDVLRDRDRRLALHHKTVTAAICGDPLR